MSSKENTTVPSDMLDDAHTPPDPPISSHVLILYANAHPTTLTDPKFYVRVSKGSMLITSTKDAASRMVASVSDKWAAKQDHQLDRQQVRASGEGIQDDGDLCCDVTKPGADGSTVLQHRVHAWKVPVFS
jgi:hypothetical protein